MAELSSAIQLAMITCAASQVARSAKYSLTKPVPIFRRNGHGEGALHRPPLFGGGPAGSIGAKVGAAAGQPARIQDQLAIDGGKALQFTARLDLATPDAGAQRFSACRFRPPGLLPLLPPPLAGKYQGGGPNFPRWA